MGNLKMNVLKTANVFIPKKYFSAIKYEIDAKEKNLLMQSKKIIESNQSILTRIVIKNAKKSILVASKESFALINRLSTKCFLF